MKKHFFISIILFAILVGCTNEPTNIFQGYVEGEYVHVASPIGGKLNTLAVSRGQHVTAGTNLFILERAFEEAAVKEAQYGLQQSQDDLANREKGQRPSEIATVQARLRQAKVAVALAKIEYQRRVKLITEKTISQEELDRSKSDFEQKAHQVKQISSELTTARLGGRSDEISAAKAKVLQAESHLDQTLWNFNQKEQNATMAGLIFDTLYRPGEWVAAGQPVISLLPPENVEVRFFVPQTRIGSLKKGMETIITFDGGPKPVPAKITYISPSAEFTPPVIYSSTSRAKLVFMIKARPSVEDASQLHPGQPVDVMIPALQP